MLSWLTVILGAELIFAAYHAPAIAVRRIRVHGVSGLPPAEQQQAVDALRIMPRTSLLRLPSARLTSSALRLPYVSMAHVSRHLPDTADIRIVPREPAAILSSPAGMWEVGADGGVLRPLRPGVTACSITCPGGFAARPGGRVDDDIVRCAVDIAAARKPSRAPAIANIVVDQNRDICLNMKDGVIIRLGSSDEMGTKLALVDRIYTRDPHMGQRVSSIDLRCPSAPACTPRPAGNNPPVSATAVSADIRPGNPMASGSGIAGGIHSRRRH